MAVKEKPSFHQLNQTKRRREAAAARDSRRTFRKTCNISVSASGGSWHAVSHFNTDVDLAVLLLQLPAEQQIPAGLCERGHREVLISVKVLE